MGVKKIIIFLKKIFWKFGRSSLWLWHYPVSNLCHSNLKINTEHSPKKKKSFYFLTVWIPLSERTTRVEELKLENYKERKSESKSHGSDWYKNRIGLLVRPMSTRVHWRRNRPK